MTRLIHHRNGSAKAFAAMAFGLGLSWSAGAAAECFPPEYSASDSDIEYSLEADRNSNYNGPSGFVDWKSYYIDRFGFQSDEGWGGNYGWDDKDNPKLPLGRTLGAIFLLHHSDTTDTADWNTREGNMLKWMYGYTAGAFNEIDDLRGGGCHEWKAADTDDEWYEDTRVILYERFFVSNVIARASILVHEAYHFKSGLSHTDGDKKDLHFYYDQYHSVQVGRGYAWVTNPNASLYSVYALQGRWLLDYFDNAARFTTVKRRNNALSQFKTLIEDKITHQDTLPEYIIQALEQEPIRP